MKSIEKIVGPADSSLERLKYIVSAGSDFKDKYIWTLAPSLAYKISRP